MRYTLKLLSFSLGFYLLVLPFAMVQHAWRHSFEQVSKEEVLGVFVTADHTSGCEFCTLYFDQERYAPLQITYDYKKGITILEKELRPLFGFNSFLHNHLRGPPWHHNAFVL